MMMSRRILIIGMVAIVVLAALAWIVSRKSPPPPAPPPAAATKATKPPPEVAIQDQATIDFSSGKPKVSSTPEDKAIIEKAAKEMEEAARDVVFDPPTAKPKPTTAK